MFAVWTIFVEMFGANGNTNLCAACVSGVVRQSVGQTNLEPDLSSHL